jgi:type I restriction enzyme, S subunit
MKGWMQYTFGEVVDFPPTVKLYKGERYPFIEMENIDPSKRQVTNRQYRTYGNSSCSKFNNDDVLLARITPCLENGKIAQVRLSDQTIGFGSTEFFVFRAKHKLLDKNFLFYLSKCDLIWKNAVNSMVGASGRQRADAAFLRKVKLKIPPLPTQRKVAAILSAYDDLIENNNRRIAILEKMAEDLYLEWFVRMRFPGHENVKIIKGVPEGWGVVGLGDIVELAYGKALKEEERNFGEYPVYGSSGVVGYHDKFLVKKPGIIVGRKGNVGSLHWSDKNFYPIDTVYFAKSKINPVFLFYLLQKMNFINNDAAVPGLNRKQAYSNKLILPTQDLIKQFADYMNPVFSEKNKIAAVNDKLKNSRNRLLSRLMSGRLDAEKLDIRFPESMLEAEALEEARA